MYLLDFGILPEAGMGRADLPIEVYTWLRAVQLARREAAK